MKKLCVLLLLLLAGNLYAQTGLFTGLGIEGNANTREGAALGGSLTFGLDITDIFAAGVKVTFSSNIDTVTALEPAAFFRYYFLPLPLGVLFLQAELGATLFFEAGETYPSFYGGLGVGWRFNVWKGLYLEPMFRGGYPFAWGIGLSLGYQFDL
jgi:hypothetical protein